MQESTRAGVERLLEQGMKREETIRDRSAQSFVGPC